MRDWILHVDLDQFLAAVEVLRRPELAGRPVVVGGDGDPTRPRQVVATASYEARAFGVRSGMPLRPAARRCPDAVFLPSDRPAYDAASAEVMATLRSFPVVVEVWGWDEAFVGAATRRPRGAGPGRAGAGARPRPGCRCAVGIGETQAAGQDGDRLRQARRRRPAHPRDVDRRRWATGPSPRCGASATARPAPGRGRHRARSPSSPAPTTTTWPAGSARRSAPTCASSASAATTSPVVDEPHVARSPQQGGDVHHRRRRPRPRSTRARRAGWPREVTAIGRRRGPAGHPRRREGAHGDVLHPHQDQQAAGADDRSGRGRARWRSSVLDRFAARPPGPPARRPGRARTAGVTSTIVADVVS